MDNTDETTRKHDQNDTLENSFCEITSATPQEALFFLESHQWDLDAALSTFLDDNAAVSRPQVRSDRGREESSPEYSPSRSRSRSPSPMVGEELGRAPYELRSRGKNKKKAEGSGTRGGIRTLADLNRTPEGDEEDEDDDDDDELQEYYTGGEKSGMLVQDPTNRYEADAIFDHAKKSGSVQRPTDRPSSSSRSFSGTARLLSGESVHVSAQPPETVTHVITLWRNGFTVNDGPLRRFDDPANASFLESIKRSECPTELQPADRRTKVHLDLMRREEDYSEPKKRQSKVLFQGVGRTLGGSDSAEPAASNSSAPSSLMTAPLPTSGLVIDSSLPTTSIQLRLSDGTRMVSRFNLSHTISDMRAFIDASRPGGARNYQLQTMGFPPKPLTNLDQTIEEAGIANSVVIQKF